MIISTKIHFFCGSTTNIAEHSFLQQRIIILVSVRNKEAEIIATIDIPTT